MWWWRPPVDSIRLFVAECSNRAAAAQSALRRWRPATNSHSRRQSLRREQQTCPTAAASCCAAFSLASSASTQLGRSFTGSTGKTPTSPPANQCLQFNFLAGCLLRQDCANSLPAAFEAQRNAPLVRRTGGAGRCELLHKFVQSKKKEEESLPVFEDGRIFVDDVCQANCSRLSMAPTTTSITSTATLYYTTQLTVFFSSY